MSRWLRLAVLPWLARAVLGKGSQCSSATTPGAPGCPAEDQAVSSLLQQPGRQQSALQRSTPSLRAIAFQGNGFTAFSQGAATTAAMLHLLRRGAGASSADLGALFRNFDMVTSNSGGTWYATQLIYSHSFVNLTNAMAAEPADAGVIFNDTWVNALLSVRGIDPATAGIIFTVSQCVALIAASTPSAANGVPIAVPEERNVSELNATLAGVTQALSNVPLPLLQDAVIFLAALLQEGGVQWDDVVASFMRATSGITTDVLLGSEPAPWARGKQYIAGVSIPTPDSSTPVWYVANSSKQFRYYAGEEQDAGFRMYTPARLSIVLGAGSGAAAPHPLCGTSDCFAYGLELRGASADHEEIRLSASGAEVPLTMAQSAGRLPVAYVAAASSAALGCFQLSRPLADRTANCLTMSSLVSSAPLGASFAAAHAAFEAAYLMDTSRNEDAMEMLAAESVQALIDGGYTDNTGIAWAVGSGATEVLAIMNDPTNEGANLYQLFAGAPPVSGHLPFGMLASQIFAESVTQASAAYEGFPRLNLPANTLYVTAVAFGTIVATTVDNQWFNVTAGKQVRLHVLSVETSNITMVAFSDYYSYGTLVGEIVDTLVASSNSEAAKTILDTFYLGVGGSR